MSKNTDAYKTYMLLMGFADNVIFNVSYVRKRIPAATSGGVGNMLSKLQHYGALTKLRRSEYKLNKEKLIAFGHKRNWKSTYTSSPRRVVVPRSKVKTSSNAVTDIDVLGNLLDAMVKAEPVIKKYKVLAAAFDSIKE